MDQLRLIVDGLPVEPEPATDDAARGTSVTGLVTLASCPQRFYWSEVDRLPRRPAPWLRHGVDVHRRIELHHRGTLGFETVTDDLYDVIGEESTDADVGSAIEVFAASRFAEHRPRYIESPIDLRIGDARLRGRIDAVYEPSPGAWEIVDFKTGRRRDDPAAIVQLEAYAVAAAEGAVARPEPEAITVTFAYLGGGTLDEVTHDVDPEWLARARQHITALMTQAQGAEFPPTPSPACQRCDFLAFCEAGKTAVGEAGE